MVLDYKARFFTAPSAWIILAIPFHAAKTSSLFSSLCLFFILIIIMPSPFFYLIVYSSFSLLFFNKAQILTVTEWNSHRVEQTLGIVRTQI